MHNNENEDPRHWHNWISSGEILQIGVMLVVIAITYAKQSANIDELRASTAAQAALISQLHEALDSVRSQRTMTPEAAQRIGVLDQRVTMLESDRQEFRNETRAWMQRVETKLDDHLDRVRK